MSDNEKTTKELFAEWVKTQFDDQSGNITSQFFTTETEEQEKDQE